MRLLAPVLALAASGVLTAGHIEDAERLQRSAIVFSEIMDTPDKAIPQDLLDNSHCVVVVPGLKKAAFVFGARYGRGFVSCRKAGVGWGAPAAIRVEGGSFGLQIGGSETDVVMLIMNERGVDRLLTSRFTLGGDASVAAGPVGRETTVQTDALLSAEILSWSRSRGVFAGLALTGATLRQDLGTNRSLYGKSLDNKEILRGNPAVPEPAAKFVSLLTKYSARK